jgi:hypothetical protein
MERWTVAAAGLAHLGLIVVGLQVPRAFRWREELGRLGPSNRILFWTYGAFIVLANAGFGALSLAYPAEIAAGRGFAGAFALFLALYWAARLAFQYAAFRAPDWPAAGRSPWVKHGLGALFLAMALVYLAAFLRGRLP